MKFKDKAEAEEAVEANLEGQFKYYITDFTGATVEGQSLKVEYYFAPTHKRKRREGEDDVSVVTFISVSYSIFRVSMDLILPLYFISMRK